MNTNGTLKQHINDRDKGIGYTALVFALLKEHVDTVAILLEYGADPNCKDIYGKVPLSLLAVPQPIKDPSAERRLKIAELLLKHGASPSIEDKFGNEPLWYAVFEAAKGVEERLPFVELLLENGANPQHQNNAKASPLSFATKVGWQPLLEIMESEK